MKPTDHKQLVATNHGQHQVIGPIEAHTKVENFNRVQQEEEKEEEEEKQTMSKLSERLLASDGGASSWPKSRQPPHVGRDNNKVVAQEQLATIYSKEDATSAAAAAVVSQRVIGAATGEPHSRRAKERKRRVGVRRKRQTTSVFEAEASHLVRDRDEAAEAIPRKQKSDLVLERLAAQANGNEQTSLITTQQQQAGKANELAEGPPLIHTDQLNTTTKLLYVYPPSSTDRRILANTHHERHHHHHHHHHPHKNSMSQRRQRQQWRDQSSQMVAAASEPNGTPGGLVESPPEQAQARLEVLNLEVTNTSATLTWALSVERANRVGVVAVARPSDNPELNRDLKKPRSIGKRDTDSVGAGSDSTRAADLDELAGTAAAAAAAAAESERDKRFWVGPRGRANKHAALSEEPTTTTTEGPGLDDILYTNNNSGKTTDTPFTTTTTIITESPIRGPAQLEPNVVSALPSSSFGPSKRPPNRSRKPSGIGVSSTSTSGREPRTTRPPSQGMQTVITTTTTTSERPLVATTTTSTTTTTRSTLPTLPVRPIKSTSETKPLSDDTAAINSTDPPLISMARTQPIAFRLSPATINNQDQETKLATATTTTTTETEPPFERMASVPLNRLQPIGSATKPAGADEKDKSGTLGSTQLASLAHQTPQSSTAATRVISKSVSVSFSVTTTRHPASGQSSQRPTTKINDHQEAGVKQHTTRAGKSMRSELTDSATGGKVTSALSLPAALSITSSGTINSTKPTELRTTTGAPKTTTTTTTTTTVTPAGSLMPVTSRPEQTSTTTTTTTREPEVSFSITTLNVPTSRRDVPTIEGHREPAAMASTTRALDVIPPTRHTPALVAVTSQPERVGQTPATPTDGSTSLARTAASQVVSMSKSQMVTSESLRQSQRQELERSKQLDVIDIRAASGEVDAASTPPSDEFAATQMQRAPLPLPPQRQPLSSKWLVRLRRFGSNEVDIVKVVVRDLDGILRESPQLERSITFKNLTPSSGYEICVESASPNQLISDKSHILNANHFLKCHDVSDVELSETRRDTNSTLGSSQESLRRMDVRLNGQLEAPDDGYHLLALNSSAKLPQLQSDKMKSLCREFFTLASGDQRLASAQFVAPSDDNPSSGPAEPAAGQPRRPKSLAGQHQQQSHLPTGALLSHVELMEINGGGGGINESRWQPSASTFEMFASSSSGNRAPSFMLGSEVGPNPLSTRLPSSLGNETTTLSGVVNRSTPLLTGSGNANKLFDGEGTHIVPIVGCVFVLIFLATIANMLLNLLHCDAPPRRRSSSDSATASAAAAAAAGMLAGQSGAGGRLSRHLAGHREERRRRRRRRQRLTDALGGLGRSTSTSPTVHTGNLTLRSPAHQLLAATPTLFAGHAHNNNNNNHHHHHHHHKHQRHFSNSLSGSYYSNASDQSATSKSRIVIVGKNGEPFGSAAGYFDVPPERHLSPVSGLASPVLRNSQAIAASGDNNHQCAATNEANHLASVYMLSSAVRFPLGPSFEGDEKHNADMVGLARRNYDNFINTIYNADEHTSELLANANLNSGRRAQSHTAGGGGGGGGGGGCSADNQYQQLVVTSSLEEERARNAAAATTTGTVHAQRRQQRLRFDKVNPIYNMDGIQQRMSQQLASFGQPSPRPSVGPSSQADECRSVHDRNSDANTAEADAAASQSSPGSSRSGGSGTSGLDKQKQRFQAQQQQLERVVSKSGSLVPQPFINVSSEVGSEPESNFYLQQQQQQQQRQQTDVDHSTHISMDNLDQQSSGAEFMFGDHLPRPPSATSELEQLRGASAPTPPSPPPPPAPLTPLGSPPMVQPPMGKPQAVAEKLDKEAGVVPSDNNNRTGKSQRQSLVVNLQAIGGSQTAPNETINKRDFAQRRNELASKLHLPGMTSRSERKQMTGVE